MVCRQYRMMSTCQVGINDGHWERNRARAAVGCGFRSCCFDCKTGSQSQRGLRFPKPPYNPGRPDFRRMTGENLLWGQKRPVTSSAPKQSFSRHSTFFFVIRYINREIVHVAATAYPSVDWAAQQIVESCTFFPRSGAISIIRNFKAQWRPNWDARLRAKPQAHWDATSARRPHRRYSGSSKRCLPGRAAVSNWNWRHSRWNWS
jgi:hypothetical protein